MKSRKDYIVFFDLDRTIVSMNSGYALGMTAYSRGLMGKADLIKALFKTIFYKLGLKSAENIIIGMGKWLGGLRQETVSDLAEEAVNKYLMNSVYPGFYDELLLHKSRNAHTALLSSSIFEICNSLALNLGIDSVICTIMEFNNGFFTGLPAGNYCYGAEKKVRLSEFCKENGFDTESCWYYADSSSDIAALELAGNPVCVNPDRKLKRTAARNGWRIIIWRHGKTKN